MSRTVLVSRQRPALNPNCQLSGHPGWQAGMTGLSDERHAIIEDGFTPSRKRAPRLAPARRCARPGQRLLARRLTASGGRTAAAGALDQSVVAAILRCRRSGVFFWRRSELTNQRGHRRSPHPAAGARRHCRPGDLLGSGGDVQQLRAPRLCRDGDLRHQRRRYQNRRACRLGNQRGAATLRQTRRDGAGFGQPLLP